MNMRNHRRNSVVTISRSLEVPGHHMPMSEFFFTTDHCQGVAAGQRTLSSDWVPCTFSYPSLVAPRAGLEDGVIDSVEKLVFVYHSKDRLIPNPDPAFEVKHLYDRFPMLYGNVSSRVPKNAYRGGPRIYTGRDEMSEVQRKIMELWEPEQMFTFDQLKAIFDTAEKAFMAELADAR